MNNSTRERRVWGAPWHIAGTNLPAARGSAEWTQLIRGQGWGPLGDRQTPPRSWGSRKVYHTYIVKCTFSHTHSPLLSHSCLSLLYQGKGGCMSRICHPRMPAVAPVNACTFLLFFLLFFFLPFLASVALFLCMSMLCPLSDKGNP